MFDQFMSDNYFFWILNWKSCEHAEFPWKSVPAPMFDFVLYACMIHMYVCTLHMYVWNFSENKWEFRIRGINCIQFISRLINCPCRADWMEDIQRLIGEHKNIHVYYTTHASGSIIHDVNMEPVTSKSQKPNPFSPPDWRQHGALDYLGCVL